MNAILLVNRLAPRKAENGDERLSDLGLDQLDKISIAIDIEMECGCELPDREVFSWVHVSDVSRSLSRITNPTEGKDE